MAMRFASFVTLFILANGEAEDQNCPVGAMCPDAVDAEVEGNLNLLQTGISIHGKLASCNQDPEIPHQQDESCDCNGVACPLGDWCYAHESGAASCHQEPLSDKKATALLATNSTKSGPGNVRSCLWVGDPHVTTFDGGRHDTYRVPATYWVIQSENVKVQAYYQSVRYRSWKNGLTLGVAYSGDFIGNHRLVIKKDIPTVGHYPTKYNRASFPGCRYLENQVLWDGNEVSLPFTNDYVSVSQSSSRITVDSPAYNGRHSMRSCYMDNYAEMANNGAQTGQCGNNNGDVRDDTTSALQDQFPVADTDNLFD